MDKYRDTEIIGAEVREITPGMASKILSKNEVNRNLSQSKAQYYARMMREGSWRLTHQGIAISEDGDLVDGQHRLVAVTMYGKPVRFLVSNVRATDGEGRLTAIGQPLDNGKIRTIADITDEPPMYVTVVNALIRDFVPNGIPKSKDPEIVAASINILRDSLSALSRKCGTTKKGLSTSSARAIIVLRHQSGIDCTDEYADALHSRFHRLGKSWVSWATRLQAMSEGKYVPKNLDFRRYVAAITWQVTDPDKDDGQAVVVKNVDRYTDIISTEIQSILFPALTKAKIKGKEVGTENKRNGFRLHTA